MSVTVSKALDRAYLLKQFEKFAGHEIYEKVQVKVIDTPENYTRCASTDVGAIEVTSDNLLIISVYIEDIAIGEYVLHQEEISHTETQVVCKFSPRSSDNMSDDEISDLFDAESETVKAYKSLIKDDVTSTTTLWSSDKTNTELEDLETTIKEYVLQEIGKKGAVSIKVVTELPTDDPQENILYVLKTDTSNSIYIYSTQEGWINTGIDLSSIQLDDYYKKTEVDTLLTAYPKSTTVIKYSDIKTNFDTTSDADVVSSKAIKTELDKRIIVSDDITYEALA